MKRLITLAIVISIVLTCFTYVFAADGFSDLPQGHWAYGLVSDSVAKGIINGFEDGTFKPDESVTRAQLAKLIALSAKLESRQEGDSGFADVAANDWYYGYIKACQDFFSGEQRFPDGLYMFYPDTNASRLVAAIAVVKAMKLDIADADLTLIKDFKDIKELSEGDSRYVALAVSKGIITGYPDGTFKPEGELTRAEAVAVREREFNGCVCR